MVPVVAAVAVVLAAAVVAGVVVMYTGCGMMIVATIQLVRKKR